MTRGGRRNDGATWRKIIRLFYRRGRHASGVTGFGRRGEPNIWGKSSSHRSDGFNRDGGDKRGKEHFLIIRQNLLLAHSSRHRRDSLPTPPCGLRRTSKTQRKSALGERMGFISWWKGEPPPTKQKLKPGFRIRIL